MSYLFDHAWKRERERLTQLEAAFDPITIECLLEADAFDLVHARKVLEHLPDPAPAFKAMYAAPALGIRLSVATRSSASSPTCPARLPRHHRSPLRRVGPKTGVTPEVGAER